MTIGFVRTIASVNAKAGINMNHPISPVATQPQNPINAPIRAPTRTCATRRRGFVVSAEGGTNLISKDIEFYFQAAGKTNQLFTKRALTAAKFK
jgi:hypothetical protein